MAECITFRMLRRSLTELRQVLDGLVVHALVLDHLSRFNAQDLQSS